MWYKCKSRRPISQGQRIDFSQTKFSILSTTPRENGCCQLWKILEAAHVAAIFQYISFQKLRTHTHGKYTQNWIISRSRNFTFFFVFFKFYQFSQLQIVKLFVFQTWILFLSIFFFFFLHNRTTLPQLLIHLPATKIGLGVIILPGYKVK